MDGCDRSASVSMVRVGGGGGAAPAGGVNVSSRTGGFCSDVALMFDPNEDVDEVNSSSFCLNDSGVTFRRVPFLGGLSFEK